MNRRILPLTIVIVTFTVVFGLHHTVRLYAKPATEGHSMASAAAAFTVEPMVQGRFTRASEINVFDVTVKNTGEAATDTFELQLISTWSAGLFEANGTTPLTDTNGNGGIDTGVVPSGQSFQMKVKFETPPNAIVGDNNQGRLEVQSTISPTLIVTAFMQNAVPAPFTQALYQQSSRAMSLLVSSPEASWRAQTTPDEWYGSSTTLAELAVEETDIGYIYTWINLRHSGFWRGELEYRLTDKDGVPLSAITKLTDHSQATVMTLDKEPAVAVAPDGHIGVVWYREIELNNPERSKNFNVYFSILDPNGQPITDTINLTNNDRWRDGQGSDGLNVPLFRSPRIAATRDNHFFVAWASSVVTHTEVITEIVDLEDVYYAIYASDGISATEAINLSNNVPGQGERSIRPAVTRVGENRVFLSWTHQRPFALGYDDIFYTVVDSSNVTVKPPSEMADDAEPVEWSNYDMVELSTGDVIAAWQAFGCPGYEWSARIRFAIFRTGNYNRSGPPECLPPTVTAVDGDEGVSLTADGQGNAIVTWTDLDYSANERRRLYYALLRANGNVRTDPMIFYESAPSEQRLSTGLTGYGNATRLYLDLEAAISPASTWVTSVEPVTFTLGARNDGSVNGLGVTMTLTLAPSLTYQTDNAPITPTIDGQTVTWSLEQLTPWSQLSFEVQVSTDASAGFGNDYPLTTTVIATGKELDLANNSAEARIRIGKPSFLPLIVTNE